MEPKPKNGKRLLFVLEAILLTIYFPPFFCLHDDGIMLQPKACGDMSGTFNCGNVRYISKPFWFKPMCASRPDYELICEGGVPMLNISSSRYRVQEIDYDAHTLTIVREDLWDNTCPEILRNITKDFDGNLLYEYLPEFKENNVTLYYDCFDNPQSSDLLAQIPNTFSCEDVTDTRINLFDVTSAGPGPNITCADSITVPVTETVVRSLRTPEPSSINILRTALASGFSVRWLLDDTPLFPPPPPQQSLQGMPPPQSTRAPSYSPESDDENRHTGQGQKLATGIIIVVVLLTVTGGVIVSIVIWFYLKRRHSRAVSNQKYNQDVESILVQHGILAPKRYKYSEIKKMTKSFNEKLGKGGYGSVYKGVLLDGSLVAVKVLIETDSNGEEFINEVASISRTSHVNIVNLLGFSFDQNNRSLVYEYMPKKSLDKYLINDCSLDLDKLCKIAVGVAKGLEYLHMGCNTRIVHFDIKPQNILLDEEFCPKISDFGLAKLCKKKQSILSVFGTRGTIGYIAPEVFSRNFGGVSHKSDVYSYGMMVLEMAGARKFVDKEAIQSSENYFPDKIYEHVVDVTRKLDDIIIDGEEEIARKMFFVGFWCIQTSPSERPPMSKVVEMLEGSIESILIPPKPVLCNPSVPDKEISSFSSYVETKNSAED